MSLISSESKSYATIPGKTSPNGLKNYISGTTLATSDGPAWTDISVHVFTRHHVQHPFLVPAVAEPLIVWVMSGSATVEERDFGGEWSLTRVSVGDFFLTRSPVPYEMRWKADGDQPFRVLHVYISIPLFEKVGAEMRNKAGGHITLQEVSGGRDTTISDILSLIHGELTAEKDGGALFVEGMAQSLVVHLLRHYVVKGQEVRTPNALPGLKLRRSIAFMAARIDQPFSLNRLANEVGMSEFHFSRLFKRSTGVSPSRYFITQRVAKAQKLLQETDISVIGIGVMVGYSSPSHFAQVFRRETGLSPSHYRRGEGNSICPKAN